MKRNTINYLALGCLSLTLCFTSCQKDDGVIPTLNPGNTTNDVTAGKQLPQVPAILEVPAGNHLSFAVYATGDQIYKCLPTAADPNVYAWVFQSPLADLYHTPAYTVLKGTHYAGPTWANNDGTVAGVRLQGATVDATAIPWLLLQATTHTGTGDFSTVTYIQRVNTVGGLAPTTDNDAAHVNEVRNIPYTAKYYFYEAD